MTVPLDSTRDRREQGAPKASHPENQASFGATIEVKPRPEWVPKGASRERLPGEEPFADQRQGAQREHRRQRDRGDDGSMPRASRERGAFGSNQYKNWVCEECMPRGLSYLRLQDKLHSSTPGPRRAQGAELGEVDEVPWFVDLMNMTSPAFRRMQDAVRDNETIWTDEVQTTSNVFLSGRKAVDDKFKPGVQSIQLIFTDHDGGSPVKMPWWYTWQPVLRPILEEVFAANVSFVDHNLLRLQLARMTPGASIRRHSDTGGWAQRSHRVHVPLVGNDDVRFTVVHPSGDMLVPVDEGRVFELNNIYPHFVSNDGPHERIHLLIDYVENSIPKYKLLRPGQKLDFNHMRAEWPNLPDAAR